MQGMNRPIGVRVPENQSTEQAPVMTVTQYTKIEFGLVEYGDERGIKRTTVTAVVGGKVFTPPQGEMWAAGFRSFVKAIGDQILERHEADATKSTAVPVPTTDAVDVTGG